MQFHAMCDSDSCVACLLSARAAAALLAAYLMPITGVEPCCNQQPRNVSPALKACSMHWSVAILFANAEIRFRAVLI
jgi:hypothetical protein